MKDRAILGNMLFWRMKFPFAGSGIPLRFTVFLIIITFLSACSPNWHLSKTESAFFDLSRPVAPDDSALVAEISPYKLNLEKTMNEVLNTSVVAMTKNTPEGLLGNFVADLILKKANEYYDSGEGGKVNICILNNGGLRTPLPQGDITRGKVFELMPFENEMCVLTFSGNSLKNLFDYLAKSGGAPVAGVKMGIENGNPVNIMVNGLSFDTAKTYRVVTSDYLANGGDKYSFLRDTLERSDLGIKIRDAIIQYITEEKKAGRPLDAKFDGRIYHVH